MSAANKNSAKFEPIKAMSFVGWLERSGPNLRATNSESDGFHLKIHTKRVMSHKEFLPGRGHMHQHAVFSSLSHGTPLAASIESSEQQRLAWIGVYPLDLSRRLTQEFLRANGLDVFPSAGLAYRIRTIEVQRRLIETDTPIGEPELENTTSKIVFSDDELLRLLGEIGVPIEALELPYKSDYPI